MRKAKESEKEERSRSRQEKERKEEEKKEIIIQEKNNVYLGNERFEGVDVAAFDEDPKVHRALDDGVGRHEREDLGVLRQVRRNLSLYLIMY